jgi:hypothetical protein
MDTTKYPNRTSCSISQYQQAVTYVMAKYTDYLKARMERKIERQQETLSGALNNFSGTINK